MVLRKLRSESPGTMAQLPRHDNDEVDHASLTEMDVPKMRKEIADTLAQLQLIPMLVFEAGTAEPLGKFYVSKVQLEEGLKFIAEGHDAEQRQARRRHIYSNLIAASHK